MRMSVSTRYIFQWISQQGSVFDPKDFFDYICENGSFLRSAEQKGAKHILHLSEGGRICFFASPTNPLKGILEVTTPTASCPKDLLCYKQSIQEMIKDFADEYESHIPDEIDGQFYLFEESGHDKKENVLESYQLSLSDTDKRFFNSLAATYCFLLKNKAFISKKVFRFFEKKILSLYQKNLLEPLSQAIGPFLASRLIIVGAGSFKEDGSFHLYSSEEKKYEKAFDFFSLEPIKEAALSLSEDFYHLIFSKGLSAFDYFEWVHIHYSSSNRCQVADYMKYAATQIVIKMFEEKSFKKDQIVFADEALSYSVMQKDLSGRIQAEVVSDEQDASAMSALQIQNYYLEQAVSFLKHKKVATIEEYAIIDLWSYLLDHLNQQNYEYLFGKLDWVTKKVLIDRENEASFKSCKKTDLTYHDLREGPLWLLQTQDLLPFILDIEDVIRVMMPMMQGAKLKPFVNLDSIKTLIADHSMPRFIRKNMISCTKGMSLASKHNRLSQCKVVPLGRVLKGS